MFIGHFALGFGAKAAAPKVSLGTLFLAAQLLDLLWPTFLLLGWEQVAVKPGITKVNPLDFTYYPFSHSLLLVLGWSLLAGLGYWLARRDRQGALVIGLAVASHWFLDLVMHRPDLPLYPGSSPLLGLGLWHSVSGSLVLELLLAALGVGLYASTTTYTSKTGRWAFWGLVAFLVLVHLANLFGPPPTHTAGIAWGAQLQWLLVLWAYWVDRYRQPQRPAARVLGLG